METLNCVIERITYHNEQNGWSVVRVSAKGYRNIFAAVGTMPEVHVGAVFNLHGEWKNDPRYGLQFVFDGCEETLPVTANGIEKYLGSGLIKGIGPVYAARIVETFGAKTLKILDKHPERLSEVRGIGPVRIEKIKKSWIEQKEIKNIMLFLQSHEVSVSIAAKIYKHYGKNAVAIVTENPYRLADEIWGIGFKTADTVAKKLGFGNERFERLRSGIFYTLNKLSEEGHCFAHREELIKAGAELLEVPEEKLAEPLEKMIEAKDLICETSAIYLPVYYYSETGTAKRLLNLMDEPKSGNLHIKYPENDARTRIRYDEAQLKAIKAALDNKVLVITGGPGTGKTTTTLGIIRAYQKAGAKILLAAPTGRAAQRMGEVTGMEAKTIHRLLEMRPPEGFQRYEDNPLEGDVLIVDECSMIDILLMYSLLKAVPDNMTLIMVGDVDQLPSVGAGKVLSDIISSGAVPVVRLEKIFRQAMKSHIITNAHRINNGEMPWLTDSNSDFLFSSIKEEDGEDSAERSEKAAEKIIWLCSDYLPNEFNVKPNDIQVLTPMRRGAAGAANLNIKLQEALNQNRVCLKRAGTEYRVGDRVMQIRNNYFKGVFNGDIGFVEEVDTEDDELLVRFDGRLVDYEMADLDELVLAYAITIHKSQGSEFPYVVMPLMTSHFMMLQRNLLYTGVTRAKKGLILVGEKKAVYIAVKNNKIVERNTRLSERLKNS